MSFLGDAWDWYSGHSDKINLIVAGLGGAALVWAAVRQARTATNRHYEQTRADQQRRLTESFSKAVEQLAGDKIEARLGGIYTLERLAIEAIAQLRSPPWWGRLLRSHPFSSADPVTDLYWTVMETLTAFVRERAKWQPAAVAEVMACKSDYLWGADAGSDAPPAPCHEPATDIAAVLAVIKRRPAAGRAREEQLGWRLDLRATDLRGANFFRVHLERALLDGAHLERAYLLEAHLEAAILGAHLEDADLGLAHLEGTHLHGVYLEGAYLLGASFKGASLHGAHLEGADLSNARLDDVVLSGAHGDARTRLPAGAARPTHWSK